MRRQSYAAEVAFDLVASPVKALGTIGFLRGIAAARDDRQGAVDLLAHPLAIGGLVGGNGEWRLGGVEHVVDQAPVTAKFSGRPLLSTMAWIFVERTATDADRLILLPLYAAGRTMGFHNCAVEQIQTVARSRCERIKNPFPDAAPRPAVEAIVRRLYMAHSAPADHATASRCTARKSLRS